MNTGMLELCRHFVRRNLAGYVNAKKEHVTVNVVVLKI